ncbi:MAG: hypothetical protein M3273_01525 [Actinomycetota bacterium]|nr:hypothetical protein [Actinomycetota bacterium]
MKGTKRARSLIVALVCAVVLVAGAGQPVGAQAPTFSVQVAQFFGVGPNCNPNTGRGCTGAESMRFFGGGVLRVHPGDTINFHSEGFHTATLLPKNTDAFRWLDGNAPPLDGPWSLTLTDPDEDFKANNRVLFPSHQDCGAADDPCSYDGSEVVNSGVFVFGDPAGTTVSVDAQAGDFFWVVCLIHPHMRMRVEVVEPGQVTSTQATIDARTAAQIALDQDWASSADARLRSKQTRHVTAGGRTVVDVFAGYDNHWVSLFGMYPKKIRIGRGDTVQFHFNQLIYEDHTATFPLARGLDVSNNEFFAPNCDPDGDAGSAPDTPPDIQGPPFCSGGPSQLEFDISERAQAETGGGAFAGADYENSGIRGPSGATNASWDLRFTKLSPDDGFGYLCVIHPFMRGRVIVRRR